VAGAYCQRHHRPNQSFSLQCSIRDQNITAAVNLQRCRCRSLKNLPHSADEVSGKFSRCHSHARPLLRQRGLLAHVLFTDEQRRIVRLILNSTLWDIENSLTTITRTTPACFTSLQAGLPNSALTLAAGFAVNAGLRRALENDPSTRPNYVRSCCWPSRPGSLETATSLTLPISA